MSLRRCMREHTERELRVWLCWLDMREWESPPSREEFYLASVACEVRQILSALSRGRPARLEDFILKFRPGEAKPPRPVDPVQALAWSKAKWAMIAGLPPGALEGGVR